MADNITHAPLIRRILRDDRWPITSDLKKICIKAAEDTLNNANIPIDEKRKWVDTLIKADKNSIDHEKIYAPKVTMHGKLDQVPNDELETRIKEVEQQLKELEEKKNQLVEVEIKEDHAITKHFNEQFNPKRNTVL